MKAILLLLMIALNCEARDLVWSDEFDGTQLDQTKWTIVEDKRREATNCKEAITVSDGYLHINTFTKDDRHYTGMINTEGKFEAAYGYWEMRVKFDDQSGTWSDAWLYSHDVAHKVGDLDKIGMEIDIFEHRKYDSNRKDISGLVNHALHWDGYGDQHKNVATDSPIKDGFNIFGLEWSKNKYQFFINGVKVWEVSPVTAKPLHLIFSTEVQYELGWTQPLLKEYKHETMTVDWIRFYR